MSTNMIFAVVCAVIAAIMMIYYSKRPNRILSVLFGGTTGAAALLILCRYGSIVGVNAELNIFNLAGSIVLGIPYVVCIVIMNIL